MNQAGSLSSSSTVDGGFGKIADRPEPDDGMMGGVDRVEQAPKVLVGVGVAPAAQCGQAPCQLHCGQHEVCTDGQDGLFGLGGEDVCYRRFLRAARPASL